VRIIYSFNKRGFEADYWTTEIRGASGDRFEFIPFNHDPYLDVSRYGRAQLLDNLYYDREPGLMKMYDGLEEVIGTSRAQALIVDNCNPYHPDWLRKQRIYKVLRTSDGPLVAYDRDIPYLHAFDHVLYHSPAHSRDLDMAEKLAYLGVRRADFWPLALFDRNFDPSKDEAALLSQPRDIDVIFIGAMFVNKMPLIAKVKKTFGSRARIHGLTSWKRNLYFNAKFGLPGWIRPIEFEEYVPLYQRARIGVNIHNLGAYTVGSYRLFDLPGNGVMQISDGGGYLSHFFDPGREIVSYDDSDDLIRKIRHYLDHDEERKMIATAGYRRVMRDHRLAGRMLQAGEMIAAGIERKHAEEGRL
jgi:spore maturation protein CgeB